MAMLLVISQRNGPPAEVNLLMRKVSAFLFLHVVAHYVCLLSSWRKNGVSEAWQRQFPRLNAHKCQPSLRLGQGQHVRSFQCRMVPTYSWSPVEFFVFEQLEIQSVGNGGLLSQLWIGNFHLVNATFPFGCGSRLLLLLQKSSSICPMRLMSVSELQRYTEPVTYQPCASLLMICLVNRRENFHLKLPVSQAELDPCREAARISSAVPRANEK